MIYKHGKAILADKRRHSNMTHVQYYKGDDYDSDHYSITLCQKPDAAYTQDAEIQCENTD
jgi:hypothetical protein